MVDTKDEENMAWFRDWEISSQSSKNKPTRITVLRQLGGIGDFLMITPVFRGLKEKYAPLGGCEITLATTWAYMAMALPMLAQGNPFIDRVVRLELQEFCPSFTREHRWDFKQTPNDPIPLCVQDTDLVIDLNVICSVVETRTMPNVVEHRTDIWCRHAAGGVHPSSKKPILNLTRAEMEEGKRWANENIGEGVRIGIVMKSNDPARDWPHVKEFTHGLCKAGYLPVTLDNSMRMDTRTWDLEKDLPAVNGKHIRQAAAIIAHLDAVVTPDTGLLHVAGALGVPILGIFGSTDGTLRMREYCGHYTDGKKVAPCAYCWYEKGCLKDKDVRNHLICMRRLTAPMVMHELESMLERFGRCQPHTNFLQMMA